MKISVSYVNGFVVMDADNFVFEDGTLYVCMGETVVGMFKQEAVIAVYKSEARR